MLEFSMKIPLFEDRKELSTNGVAMTTISVGQNTSVSFRYLFKGTCGLACLLIFLNFAETAENMS